MRGVPAEAQPDKDEQVPLLIVVLPCWWATSLARTMVTPFWMFAAIAGFGAGSLALMAADERAAAVSDAAGVVTVETIRFLEMLLIPAGRRAQDSALDVHGKLFGRLCNVMRAQARHATRTMPPAARRPRAGAHRAPDRGTRRGQPALPLRGGNGPRHRRRRSLPAPRRRPAPQLPPARGARQPGDRRSPAPRGRTGNRRGGCHARAAQEPPAGRGRQARGGRGSPRRGGALPGWGSRLRPEGTSRRGFAHRHQGDGVGGRRTGSTGTRLDRLVSALRRPLAEGYPVRKRIGNSPKNHARWQRLRALQNRSPARSVYPTPDADGGLEHSHEGETVLGLGAAHFMDGIAVSPPVAPQWQTTTVSLDRSELVELDDGSLEFEHETVDVRHVSAVPHVDEYRSWIRESSLARAATGRQIWERRADLYPLLQFLPCTEAQLSDLDPRWVVPVRRSLERLEAAAEAWDPAAASEPEWRSKVTPEGETRKRVCRFEDFDGKGETFHLHARFTPGAGRIHFRLIGQEGKIRIAHVGSKIRPDV